ncbi:DUF397 domain-containing protein [Streptomyces noursei]
MIMASDLGAAAWRKSTYSGAEHGECIEVAELEGAEWFKSSYSGDNDGQCVEVAEVSSSVVAVRDSKDVAGPALVFAPGSFYSFVESLKS